MRTLRSRGLPTRSVLLKHALRNAAPASLTVLSLQFIALISGAVVIEKVFGLNGIGRARHGAASQGDVPLVLGIVVLAVMVVVASTCSSTSPWAGSTRRCVSHEHPVRRRSGRPARRRRRRDASAPGVRSGGCCAARWPSSSLVWVLLVAVLAVLAPLLTSASPTASQIANALAPMGGANPLGADGVGRDVLAQLLYGAAHQPHRRASSSSSSRWPSVCPAGIVAGYCRGRFDAVASWVANLLWRCRRSSSCSSSWPSSAAAPSWPWRCSASSSRRVSSASCARRSLAVREELFVDAARVSGLSDGRIMRRHVLPVVDRADGHPGVAAAGHRHRRPGGPRVPRARARRTRRAGAGCSATPSRTSTPSPGSCSGRAWRSS